MSFETATFRKMNYVSLRERKWGLPAVVFAGFRLPSAKVDRATGWISFGCVGRFRWLGNGFWPFSIVGKWIRVGQSVLCGKCCQIGPESARISERGAAARSTIA